MTPALAAVLLVWSACIGLAQWGLYLLAGLPAMLVALPFYFMASLALGTWLGRNGWGRR